MTDVVIDLDTPVPSKPAPRQVLLPRLLLLGACALFAAAPAAAPVTVSVAHQLPVPSYCTGAPMPGGRLNIVEGDVYVILDGQNGVVISTGPCPRR
ncbi:hypothetical protein ACFPIJ_45490 [Dactylosporangium cerinum]|uniref:Uncharacterized protein n=1 Tax=Dactylosporangium cerinum TaxID=1434730 RepID=A0ABV9W9P2_9ACTN